MPTDLLHAATFELAGPIVEGDYVLRSGKVFSAGNYEDKAFSVTPAELKTAVTEFSPVPVDLEHAPTPFLNGKLGQLRSVSVADNGWDLIGTVALPKWLDDALEGTGRKVSATWDRTTKRLAGLAIVEHPRVNGAALMSAYAEFAAHSTPEGSGTLQRIHDECARGGAVCKASNTAKMASAHEASAIQNVHDMTTEHGATCSSKKPGQQSWPYFSTRKEGTMTNAWDWLKAKLEGEPAPDGSSPTVTLSTPAPAPAAPAPATMSADDPQLVKLREEQAANAAEIRRLRLENIHKDAVVFADAQVRELRAVPAERDGILADFVQRALDDMPPAQGGLGLVTFGEGDAAKTTSRVEMLRASFAARSHHALTTELLDTNGLVVLSNRATTDTKDKPASADRVKELLGMTTLGRAQNGAQH